MAFGVSISCLESLAALRMTLSMNEEASNWNFLQYNSLINSYACAPVPRKFTHLKLDIYDSPTAPTQHMLRFTSHMYIYNASDTTCCRIFPSFLIGKVLVWYAHLPPRSTSSFKELWEKFIQNFFP